MDAPATVGRGSKHAVHACAGRENGWECDFGFVGGPAGTCIPYVEDTEGPPAAPGPPDVPSGADGCGGNMQPRCVGDQLLGAPPLTCKRRWFYRLCGGTAATLRQAR